MNKYSNPHQVLSLTLPREQVKSLMFLPDQRFFNQKPAKILIELHL
jgi:hypothetical protein